MLSFERLLLELQSNKLIIVAWMLFLVTDIFFPSLLANSIAHVCYSLDIHIAVLRRQILKVCILYLIMGSLCFSVLNFPSRNVWTIGPYSLVDKSDHARWLSLNILWSFRFVKETVAETSMPGGGVAKVEWSKRVWKYAQKKNLWNCCVLALSSPVFSLLCGWKNWRFRVKDHRKSYTLT